MTRTLFRLGCALYVGLVLIACLNAYRQHGLTWPRLDWIGRPISVNRQTEAHP